MLTFEETEMWANPPREFVDKLTDPEINEKYARGEGRIIVENNREKLPGFYQQLQNSEYMDLRPFYQRRPRWDDERQSRLIESFLINLPVPPIFLYEKSFNSYEVMDGQQRISAIRAFFSNTLKLKGLQYWPELNGRTYDTLPRLVRAGIDRRSISSIVMLKESTPEDEDAIRLREIVFERLNTGGIELERQEIRNALFHGPFNDLLLRLSRHPVIRTAWSLPLYHEDELKTSAKTLLGNSFYSKMEDAELVLRFFALRNASHYARGMQGFLDIYMSRASKFSPATIGNLEKHFEDVIELAYAIFGDLVFRPYDTNTNDWAPRPQKAFFDAVMVGLSQCIQHGQHLYARRDLVVSETRNLFFNHDDGTFTGRGNTKADIENRIGLFASMLQGVAESSDVFG